MNDKFPEQLNLLGAVLVSVISGTASITRRLAKGQAVNLFWVTSEFLTAILCGYLMFSAYPAIQVNLPDWFTLPIAVAVAAHTGGRIFQEFEDEALKRTQKFIRPR